MTIRPSPHLLHHPFSIAAIVGIFHVDIAASIHVIDNVLFLCLRLVW